MEDVFVLTADVLSLEFTFAESPVEMPELADLDLELDEDPPVDVLPEQPIIEEPVWVSFEEVSAYAHAHQGSPFGVVAGLFSLIAKGLADAHVDGLTV